MHAPHVEPGATAGDAPDVTVSPQQLVQHIPAGLDESRVDARVAADPYVPFAADAVECPAAKCQRARKPGATMTP